MCAIVLEPPVLCEDGGVLSLGRSIGNEGLITPRVNISQFPCSQLSVSPVPSEVLGLSGVLQGLLVFSSAETLPQAARLPVLRHLLLLHPLLDFHVSCGFSKDIVSVSHHCHVCGVN